VVPPNDQLLQATYSQLLTRVYSDGVNAPIMLLMAQSGSQTGFLQIHRPETCYTASGFQITPVARHPIALGFGVLPTNFMDATADGLTEHVVFWTRVGDQLPESWKDQKLAVAEQNLRGIIPDAILVRVSTVRGDSDGARQTLDAFVRALLENIPPAQRSVFIA
jgi:EpsI family protein